MKQNLLLALLAILFNVAAFAQTKVSGTVFDEDGTTLPGVTVAAKGTTVGTITNIDGNFTLNVSSEVETIVFSFVGLQTLELPVGQVSEVTMKSDNLGLDEVVVTGLGVSREKKALGYSVQEVGGDDLNKARDANFVNSLQGKVAGVQITGSSNLGGSSRITIRGNSSITGNNQPLFVVDGVPLDNSNFNAAAQTRGGDGYDFGNMAQDINPDDIESISVLKGATAAAQYGSRGANGVILITTKKGSKGKKKGLGVSVNSSLQFNQVAFLPDYQNSYGGGSAFDTIDGQLIPNYSLDGSWGPKFNGQQVRHWDSYDERLGYAFGETREWKANPGNIDKFYETGYTASNNVSFSGGGEGSSFRLSYSNINQKGTQPNSKLGRNTISFNGSSQMSDRLKTSIGVNYVKTQSSGIPKVGYGGSVGSQFNQWFQRQVDMERLERAYEETGENISWNRKSATDPSPNYFNNPYWERYNNIVTTDRDRLFGNLRLDYELTDKINVMARAMTDMYTYRIEEIEAVGSVNESFYAEDVRTVGENNFEARITANGLKLTDNLSLTAYAGLNRSDRYFDRNKVQTLGGLVVPGFYNVNNGASGTQITDASSKRRINSVYGAASFGFRTFAYVDLSVRNDWSSTLPAGSNSYFYPAVSGSLVFSEFMDLDWLSLGKIRVGYAQVGNDTDPYRLVNTFVTNTNTAATAFSINNAINNSNLLPERTNEIEIGTELAFFDSRVGMEVSVYDKTTSDLIFGVDQSGASGATSAILNAGTVKNQGIEGVINVVPVQTRDFEWTVGLNIAKNYSEIESLYKYDDGTEVESIQISSGIFGVSLQARTGQPYQMLIGKDYAVDDKGNRLVDANGSYIATDNVVPLGSVLPDFNGGFRTGIKYKNFNLNTVIDFQKGGNIFSLTNVWGKYSGLLEETVEGDIRENGVVVDGVKAQVDDNGEFVRDEEGNILSTGEANDVNLGAQTHFFNNQGYVISAADVYDASFVKWRELRVGYSIPSRLLEKTFFGSASVSIVGRNLLILYKNVPNIDPEAAVSSGNTQGLEGGQLPTERSIGINLNLRF